jgi:hypothetical protein
MGKIVKNILAVSRMKEALARMLITGSDKL